MKVFSWTSAFCLVATLASAQEITGNGGEPILPEKGDWCISFDAIPFLEYLGNAGNQSTDNSVQSEYPNGFESTLVLKKFKEANRALRLKVRLGLTNEKFDTIVVGLSSTSPEPSVTDSREIGRQDISFGIGREKRRGKGRLQGYSGLELLIRFSSTKTTYTYGDGPLTSLVWMHTNTFGQGAGVTEVKEGNIGLNLRGLLGVEFFFAPKMSLSAEYSWGVTYYVIRETTTVREQWDFSTNKVKTVTERTPKHPSVVVDNFLDALSINLAFCF